MRVTGGELIQRAFFDALKQLRKAELWEDDKLWSQESESLPNYRLSKFQPLMPDWVQREVVAAYLLDIDGARRWLRGVDPAVRKSQ